MAINGVGFGGEDYSNTNKNYIITDIFQINAELTSRKIPNERHLYLILHNLSSKEIKDISITANKKDKNICFENINGIDYIAARDKKTIRVGKTYKDDISDLKVDITIKYENKIRRKVLKIK